MKVSFDLRTTRQLDENPPSEVSPCAHYKENFNNRQRKDIFTDK